MKQIGEFFTYLMKRLCVRPHEQMSWPKINNVQQLLA